MNKETYYYTASTLFGILAIAHLVRIFEGWEAVVAGVFVPLWFSWFAVLLAGYLSLRGFSFVRKTKTKTKTKSGANKTTRRKRKRRK